MIGARIAPAKNAPMPTSANDPTIVRRRAGQRMHELADSAAEHRAHEQRRREDAAGQSPSVRRDGRGDFCDAERRHAVQRQLSEQRRRQRRVADAEVCGKASPMAAITPTNRGPHPAAKRGLAPDKRAQREQPHEHVAPVRRARQAARSEQFPPAPRRRQAPKSAGAPPSIARSTTAPRPTATTIAPTSR